MTRWASLIHANMLSSNVFIKVRYHQQAMQDLKSWSCRTWQTKT